MKYFSEPGVSTEIVNIRYKYHQDNIKKILGAFKHYQQEMRKSNILNKSKHEDSQHETHTNSSLVHSPVLAQNLNTLEVKKTIRKASSLPDLRVIDNKREKAESMKKKVNLDNINVLEKGANIQSFHRVQTITKKSNYEFKKNQQMQRLNQVNTERELKSQKVLEKLSKCSSVFTARSTRASEHYNEKLKNIQDRIKLKELEYDTYLKNSSEKSSKNEQRVSQIITNKLKSKSEIAKTMTKNLIERRECIENELISDKINKILQKTKKLKKFKLLSAKDLKRKLVFKKLKNEKLLEIVKSNLLEEDKKLEIKIGSCTARIISRKPSESTLNSERHKQKLVRNELQRLQANTRIARNKFEFVLFT